VVLFSDKSVTKTTVIDTPFLHWTTGDVHMSLVNPKHDSLSRGLQTLLSSKERVYRAQCWGAHQFLKNWHALNVIMHYAWRLITDLQI